MSLAKVRCNEEEKILPYDSFTRQALPSTADEIDGSPTGSNGNKWKVWCSFASSPTSPSWIRSQCCSSRNQKTRLRICQPQSSSDGRWKGGTCHQKYTSNFKSHSEEPSHLFEFRKKTFAFFRVASLNDSPKQCGVFSNRQPNIVRTLGPRDEQIKWQLFVKCAITLRIQKLGPWAYCSRSKKWKTTSIILMITNKKTPPPSTTARTKKTKRTNLKKIRNKSVNV